MSFWPHWMYAKFTEMGLYQFRLLPFFLQWLNCSNIIQYINKFSIPLSCHMHENMQWCCFYILIEYVDLHLFYFLYFRGLHDILIYLELKQLSSNAQDSLDFRNKMNTPLTEYEQTQIYQLPCYHVIGWRVTMGRVGTYYWEILQKCPSYKKHPLMWCFK